MILNVKIKKSKYKKKLNNSKQKKLIKKTESGDIDDPIMQNIHEYSKLFMNNNMNKAIIKKLSAENNIIQYIIVKYKQENNIMNKKIQLNITKDM